MSIDISQLPQKPIAQQFIIEDTNPLDPRVPLSAWVALHKTTIDAIADAVIAKLEAKRSPKKVIAALIKKRLDEIDAEMDGTMPVAAMGALINERSLLREALGDE